MNSKKTKSMKKLLILKSILLISFLLVEFGQQSFSKPQLMEVNPQKGTVTVTCIGEVEEGMDVTKLSEKENFLFFDGENQIYYLIGKSKITKLQSQNKVPKEFIPAMTDYLIHFDSKSERFEDNGTIYHELFGVTSISESNE